jgi:PAS domain-containing protein
MAVGRFEPVFLPADRQLNGRASFTFLKHFLVCPRSSWLYQMHRGEAPTRELIRGAAFHLFAERVTKLMIENGEVTVPPEVAKTELAQVLAEVPVVWEDHDLLREAAWRWSEEMTIDPSKVIACEDLFQLDIGGYKVRAKVDFAEIIEGGAAMVVRDWKTSRSAPAMDEIARKRPDGTVSAKARQLVVYSLLLAYGTPVRVEEVDGERVEIPEPFPLAPHVQRADCEFVFPVIEDSAGKMVRRQMSLQHLELVEYRESLEATMRRLDEAQESGDWPAIVSDEACSICPAASQCPIPRELRDHRGTVTTVEQAAEAFAKLEREKAEQRARGTELRKFVQEHGPVIFDGKVAEIVMQESERIADRDGLLAAVERAVQFGEPFDRADFVKRVDSYPLKTRDLTAEEVAEMSTPEGGST